MIYAKRKVLGPTKLGTPLPIKSIRTIDVGYGPGQLRPDGSRQPETERRVLAKINMLTNGMSGQQTG